MMKFSVFTIILNVTIICGLLFGGSVALGQTAADDESQDYQLIENDDGDDWVEPVPQRELDAAELQRLFTLFREALGDKAYLEADTLAKRVVEMSIDLNGIDSHDSAKAITNLGIAQHHNRDYESAMRNFESSIDIIERIDDRLSSSLINPLRGLAATQALTGRPAMAKRSYERAVHVSHVNDGPHNPDQVTTLASIAELSISVGDLSVADDIQEQIYAIQSRNIDPQSLDIIPAMEIKAGWQHRLQQYREERLTLRKIISVLQRHKGKDSLELIAPLTNLGKSFLFISQTQFNYHDDVSATSGESYLRRANRIADTNPDSTWQIVESTLLALGDYYVLSGRPNRAARIYGETWALLSLSEDPLTENEQAKGDEQARLRNRRNHLETVKILQVVHPPKYYNSVREDTGLPPPENFATGSVSFSLTVSANGRIGSLKHIETQPYQLEEFGKTIGRSLRRLMYRPRIEDGKMVATKEITYTHEFFYRPSDLQAAVKNAETASETESEPEPETEAEAPAE